MVKCLYLQVSLKLEYSVLNYSLGIYILYIESGPGGTYTEIFPDMGGVRNVNVRYFPKGIFPSGNFPSLSSRSAWPLARSSRSDRPPSPSQLQHSASLQPAAPQKAFWKVTLGKLHTWEVVLGKMPLGKYLTPECGRGGADKHTSSKHVPPFISFQNTFIVNNLF